MKKLVLFGICLCLLASCQQTNKGETTQSGLQREHFQTDVDGKKTDLFVLTNRNGMEVCITNFGGRVVSLMAPDKAGNMQDIVLGFDSIQDYMTIPTDFGASIGRYANRINHGKLVVDNDTIQLPCNNFGHCLHGGPNGWQYKVYDGRQIDGHTLELTLNSPDGDENFPGNVQAKVTYVLTDDNALQISYEATTDKKTVINMTNHSYFNLSGNPANPITDHVLYLNAQAFTPVDSTFMTTGEIRPVQGTPMDFTSPSVIGDKMDMTDEQVANGKGFDHNWVLATQGDMKVPAARLVCPSTGIGVEVYTDEPGIQVYSGNFLDGTVIGKKGIVYRHRTAVCLETQHYPDSPNKADWPSVYLMPGQKYTSHCTYKFVVM